MKQRILKFIRSILKDILREMLLEIIQNRIAVLRRIHKDNQDSYDEIQDMLMKTKMQALEEFYTVIASALDG